MTKPLDQTRAGPWTSPRDGLPENYEKVVVLLVHASTPAQEAWCLGTCWYDDLGNRLRPPVRVVGWKRVS